MLQQAVGVPSDVAPSRGRGSKLARSLDDVLPRLSPPHGGADRNRSTTLHRSLPCGRPLTGARIETSARRTRKPISGVAPSRGRGSKPRAAAECRGVPRRPLTGARIETGHPRTAPHRTTSPPHGGADRNIPRVFWTCACTSRPLTGARIETATPRSACRHTRVAPSRGRGSKHQLRARLPDDQRSPPHGGADRNLSETLQPLDAQRRPLTGARIETSASWRATAAPAVAPSRGRGSKPLPSHARLRRAGRPLTGARIETRDEPSTSRRDRVAPSRGRGSKRMPRLALRLGLRRPLTGARIETASRQRLVEPIHPPPHGGADRNTPEQSAANDALVAPSRGRGSKRARPRYTA